MRPRRFAPTRRPAAGSSAPPIGAARYWAEAGTDAYVQALEDVVLVLMIEKREAVEQLDEILAVPGIDMIQWGPADYAMSIGRPGGWDHPEVKAVERDVIERSLEPASSRGPRSTTRPTPATSSIWASATSAWAGPRHPPRMVEGARRRARRHHRGVEGRRPLIGRPGEAVPARVRRRGAASGCS